MAMELVCDWTVPCLLCEEDTEQVAVYRDQAKGEERIDRVRVSHQCEPMRGLTRGERGGR